jgi:hypothetical protein
MAGLRGMARDSHTVTTAIDFATRTVFAPERNADAEREISETLGELVHSFGAHQVAFAVRESRLCAENSTHAERVLQALRAFAVLILDDDRPKLVAALVGKLARLELATGRPLGLSELGRANGVSKQAVSKKMADLADRLNLPRPDSTPGARLSHRLMNKRTYAHITPPALAQRRPAPVNPAPIVSRHGPVA